ncbi:aminomethyl-transferring glycine dehydrogenase subunit GcvPA [Candidatus Bipolaricaulota bacterium]|jgi:glycine dehydrogenase subunit 1|nr:aminomethyl-transferring glycine dehydrogenase subunit GcvPA [Candidatus Bipolaricaulota bacterium]
MRYIPSTSADRREMMAAIGVDTIEELFSDIPASVRDRFQPVGLPARSEMDVASMLSGMADRNNPGEAVCMLGGGIYDHYIPRVIGHLVSRSEFLTAYTPYQPEISQGTLTAMFEFQTLVCELTGMEIANASMYDGATALAEAVLMAERIRNKGTIAVARSLFAPLRRVLDTYCWAADIKIVEIGNLPDGMSDVQDIPEDISALVIQTPNAWGVIESLGGIKDRIGEALLVVSCHPLSLGLLQPPGAFGADIVVGEGQSLGLPMGYGGPLLGLFSTREAFLRQMPGRVSGRTVDVDGKTGYAMAAQTREQHIRRQRATSNICTNSALCALTATIYLASVGSAGLNQVAQLNFAKAHYLAEAIAKLDGYELAFSGAFFNEFVVNVPGDAVAIHDRLTAAGFAVEAPHQLRAMGLDNALRFAVTEKRTKAELDRLIGVLEAAR